MGSESEDRSTVPHTDPSELDGRPTEIDEPATSEQIPATPRSELPKSIEIEISTERPAPRAAARKPGEDTLLSLPTPADREEPSQPAPYVIELERRVSQLEARIAVLETAGGGSKRWLAWIAFMVTLAVIWQIVRALR